MPKSTASVDDRFWAKVDKTETCWNWTAYRDPLGYGNFWPADKRMVLAHRFAFELLVGLIPEGLELDHLCRNPSCCRPDHLEAVTHRENILRGIGATAANAAKTTCIRGHSLSEANLRIRPDGGRICRACRRVRARSYYLAAKT